MLQQLHVVVGEIHPDFHPIGGLSVLGGNEPEAADVLAVVEVLTHQEENEVLVDLLLVGLSAPHWEHEAAAVFIFGILPFRFDPFLEVLDRVDPAELVLDLVAE